MRAWRVVRLCGLAVALASVLWALTGVGQRAGDRARPNVLLVSIDSLRADHLGSYGYPRDTSPAIDALAREGVLFENAISSAPWTVPAHMTLLTGLPPEVHDVVTRRQKLAPDAVTLAEALAAAGYETAAFVSGPTVMAHFGFDQGFALYDESMVDASPQKIGDVVTSPGLVDLVNGWLERWSDMGRAAPFFVFLHMWDVHYDYVPPPEYVQRFDPDYTGDIDTRHFESNPRLHRDMSPRDLAHVIALYDGEIRFTDDHLARIFSRLRALGVLDETIVVVTSDHGDEFFEHGQKGHAKTLYEEVLHVPLVVRYPRRIAGGLRVAAPVRLMDVAPTILGLAGVAPPAGFAAHTLDAGHRAADLTPHVAGRAPAPMPALAAFSANRWLGDRQSAVRTAGAKLIRHAKPLPNGPVLEVFDLDRDPREQQNLAAAEAAPPLLATLDPLLDAWQADARRQTKLAQARKPVAQHEARLRALGYVE
ncbi:MAG: sulfatase [Deltaproteobacteria bacterium]|nr:sulfatase [Deltaproteobacteria bacterium]